MNLLGTSAVAEDEARKHAQIKTSITAHLKMCIKVLQNEYVKTDTPIHSGDSANALCNVQEAIFLHQLKPSIGSKLSSYFVSHSPDTDAQLCCWPFLQKFTHKDVISQLTQLSQINTDIGMCRAWIRLALNDGLLVNYLDAMMADSDTCRYFYKRTAYLRDLEHPGIMKTYIQGLSNLNFQLSCNSSILNVWTTAPLILTGHADPPPHIPHTPAPSGVIRPVTLPSRITPVAESHFTTGARVLPSPDDSTVGHPVAVRRHQCRKKHPPATPPNTPFSTHLSRRDIDVIRQMAQQGQSRSDGGSSTATSQISHPDSTDGRQFDSIISPSLQLTPSSSKLSIVSEDDDRQRWLQDVPSVLEVTKIDAPETTFRNECLQSLQQDTEIVSFESSEVDVGLDTVENEMADKRSCDVTMVSAGEDVDIKKTCDDAIKDTPAEHTTQQVMATSTETSQQVMVTPKEPSQQVMATSTETSQQVMVTPKEPSQQVMVTPKEPSQQVMVTPKEPSQQVMVTPKEPSQQVMVTPKEPSQQVMVTPKEISQQVMVTLKEPSLQVMVTPMEANTEDVAQAAAINVNSDRPEPIVSKDVTKTILKDKTQHTAAILEFSPVRKSAPLEPQPSDVTAFCSPVDQAKEADCETDDASIDSHEGYQGTDMKGASNEAFVQGNSLGSMQGWSSEFETGMPETYVSLSDGRYLETEAFEATETQNTETFVALLGNYDPSTLHPNAAAPGEGFETLSGSPTSRIPDPDILDDFVVLRPGTPSSIPIVDPQYEHLVELVGEICHEKGLDMQNYQCRGCSRPVGMFYGKARVCTYNAGYYCYECHENDEYYIPSRIIHNWDFRKHQVCKQNLEFLQQTKTAPLINVQKINRRLYDHVNEMNNSRLLRLQLHIVKKYLFTCKQCVADELRRRVSPREYLYEDIHVYSLLDLLQIHENQFAPQTHEGRTVCDEAHLQLSACETCRAVYHKACKTDSVRCPKCARYALRQIRLGSNMSSGMDYADDPAQD
ncbi:hypothetical protein LSAT2_032985 [Lamellibrachia satsuma]|nr:hypothetical protein LSAT2_032985 [Lamellibrachia satsuma]